METEKNNLNKKRLSVGLFFGGVLIGFVFNIFVVWANLEASIWNQVPNRDKPLDGLQCPLVISRSQTDKVTILYKNTLDRPIDPVVRTKISERLTSLQREEEIRPDIAPGETARIEYPVYGQDAVWDRFIMVRVNTLPQFSLPSRSGACGILVVSVPLLNGTAFVTFMVLLSVAGMVGGIWLWREINKPLQGRVRFAFQAMLYLSVCVIAGIVFELLTIWWLAMLLVFVTLILIASVLGYYLVSS